MHIVHSVPFFDPATQFGGPVAQLRLTCRGLAERGHEVSVVTTELGIGPDLAREQWIEKDGYRIWYARVGRPGRIAPYYAPRVGPALRDALSSADVLHLSLSFTHLNIVARQNALEQRVPYIYTPRSCLDPVRLRQKAFAKWVFLALFERRIIQDAARVHVLTETERDEAAGQGARTDQLVVIPNASSIDPGATLTGGDVFRRSLGIDVAAPVILFLGRLHLVKGLDVLLDGFALALREHPTAQLVLAGPDEGSQASIERQARRLGVLHAVHLPGRIDGDRRFAALAAADIFALTSRSEGMSNAILEALAAGLPLILTDRCHFPEVQTCGVGRMVTIDPTAVHGAIEELLGLTPEERIAMGTAGRRLVRDRFSLPAVLDRLEEMYHGLHAVATIAA